MLSSLDAGDKRAERDPDDSATLTEIMKKKALEDKKRKLDEQAAAALAAKKAKLQKETPLLLQNRRLIWVFFSAKHGNLLEKIFAASGSHGAKPGKGVHKEDEVEQMEVVAKNVVGVGAGGDGGGGVETDVESSGATPRHTIYTKRPPGSGGGSTSGVHRSTEYGRVQGGSWDTHNPACADLPHAPRWNLTQGSRMTELANCQKFNAEKKGLVWRVADAEEKLANQRQLNADKQKDWEVACERTNKEMQTQRDAIVRLSGEKRKISDEAEEERVAHQKRE
ncbi:hypothetical protein HanRHA438_Chr13g0603301 [Helianthus annuus]|nr:hypothetical protein HanOQP8_Chr13g0486901 [Helianthus annuus]KAJ0849600.1 hypothetical protein HanPSC8_Chr13g0570631 [Helianthus annuus]KAJ0858640.1 hypothetical protein HanRHA438_Chr13g0603301 [Helianthus annuus]